MNRHLFKDFLKESDLGEGFDENNYIVSDAPPPAA